MNIVWSFPRLLLLSTDQLKCLFSVMRQSGHGASEVLKRVFGLFPAIDIISLKSRLDRRRRVLQQLAELDIEPQSFRIRFFDGMRYDDADGFPHRGVRGCFNSHLALLKLCGHSRRPAMIMEDDISFQTKQLADIPRLPEELAETDWDIVYFGALHSVVPPKDGFNLHIGDLTGSHCCAFKPEVARRLASYMQDRLSRPFGDPRGGKGFYDAAANDFRAQNPDVKTYLVSPYVASQFSSRTDLGTEKWYDRVPGLKSAAELARTAKSGV
jgi:glycosyl transferase, family 25